MLGERYKFFGSRTGPVRPDCFFNKITTGIGEQSFNFDTNTRNLTSRSYKKTNNPATVSESFTYDNLNRLSTYQVSGQTGCSAIYSNNGNITSKTDAGSYTYDATKLNAVASVTNPIGIIPTNDQTIYYTGFNKAYYIEDGTYVQDITYGPDNQRIKSVLKNNGTVIKTKYYAPGYEKEIKSGVTRELHYVSCPYGLVAVLIKQGGTTTTYFTENDHLGSIIGLKNPDGSYAEQFSFDPWGRRRNPSNWTYTSVPQPVLIDRGFTGHACPPKLSRRREHYDNFGLIDMNGRMYDPVLGRFLGVDPIIQDAGNSQSINGYGYCLNNPLRFTDPSGYSYQRFMEVFAKEQRENQPSEFFNNYPKVWSAYTSSIGSGYTGGYGNFVTQYYNNISSGQTTNNKGTNGFYVTWETNFTYTIGTSQEVRDKYGNLIGILLPEVGIGIEKHSVFVPSGQGGGPSLLNKVWDYTYGAPLDFIGGAYDFAKNYYDMRKLNLKNSDKYFHSKANF